LLLVMVVGISALTAHVGLTAGPAYACTCDRDQLVADVLARTDAAFVGVFIGQEIFPRQAISHFQVERSVKGDVGGMVHVESDASGAACGLELDEGERTGLFLARTQTGWASGLCLQTDPEGLLAVARAGESEPASSVRSLVVPAGVLALAVALYFGVERWRRREA
jgi:hypothetical protein